VSFVPIIAVETRGGPVAAEPESPAEDAQDETTQTP